MTTFFLTVFFCFALATEVLSTETRPEKRAQTCTFVAQPTNQPINPTQVWPRACGSAPEGQYCLPAGSCGCANDYDCWTNSKSPFCFLAASSGAQLNACDACWKATGAQAQGTVENTDHYWCRESRYPAKYAVSNSDGPSFDQDTEQVAPINFYREVCFVDGSCARCDQANTGSGLPSTPYPALTTLTKAQREAIWGTIFCNSIRGPGTNKQGRPICLSEQGWTDWGFVSKVNLDRLTLQMDVAWLGDIGPMEDGLTGVIVGTDNLAANSPAQSGTTVRQPLKNWEGSCIPCAIYDSSTGGNTNPNTFPATPTPFNYLCSRALSTLPICDSTGICRRCNTNGECTQSATCGSDGSASCTGGLNCYADGSCRSCVGDTDCAGDGGEVPSQTTCTGGICTSPFRCLGNTSQGTTSDCPSGQNRPNCQSDGSCIFCRSNSDCVGDLGGQQVCNTISGLCTSCQTNADCVGTSGANCMKDGRCIDCTSSQCGNYDGGLPANGQQGRCGASSGYCVDRNNQPLCNSATRICDDYCLSNLWCSDRNGFFTVGGGLNCQMSGACQDCGTTSLTSSPNCGSNDGPNPSFTGAQPTPNQPDCDGGSRLCVAAFTCSTNAMCVGRGGNNCQQGGSCISCIVTYDTSTCSAQDGGETPLQPNCLSASRLCTGACSVNNDCIGTQGANCMRNGLCLSCRTSADCLTSNTWGGDGGQPSGQTICDTTTQLCVSACTSNVNVASSNPCQVLTQGNCMNNGFCRACTSDSDCVTNDGPPGAASNRVCNTASGICVDPFSCGTTPSTSSDNAGCQQANPGQNRNNCWQDGSCASCTSNADCFARDGGVTPRQPRCNQATGTCVACTGNQDCPTNAANCNSDGFCYDCRVFTSGTTCTINDGPPGAYPQLNCDTITGTCVNFCTLDSQCDDTCFPKCNTERGCCVECLTNSDCPVAQWRGSEINNRYCNINDGYTCTSNPNTPTPGGLTPGGLTPNVPITPGGIINCRWDQDCTYGTNGNSSTPACLPTTGRCVECLYDSHCSDPTPSCHYAAMTCVGCTNDNHCPVGFFCGTGMKCQTQVMYFQGRGALDRAAGQAGTSAGGRVTFPLVALFAFILSLFR